MLQHAMKQNPKDAKAPYYLGNLLFDHQPKKAIDAWERSRDSMPPSRPSTATSDWPTPRSRTICPRPWRAWKRRSPAIRGTRGSLPSWTPLVRRRESIRRSGWRSWSEITQSWPSGTRPCCGRSCSTTSWASTTGRSNCWTTTSIFGKDRRGSTRSTWMPICSAGRSTSRPGVMPRR